MKQQILFLLHQYDNKQSLKQFRRDYQLTHAQVMRIVSIGSALETKIRTRGMKIKRIIPLTECLENAEHSRQQHLAAQRGQ